MGVVWNSDWTALKRKVQSHGYCVSTDANFSELVHPEFENNEQLFGIGDEFPITWDNTLFQLLALFSANLSLAIIR